MGEPQTIDYDALAKQNGAISSAPAVDYDALAKQAGAISSTPATPVKHFKWGGGPVETVGTTLKRMFQDTVQQVSDVTPIGIAQALYKNFHGDPSELKALPKKATMMLLSSMIPEAPEAGAEGTAEGATAATQPAAAPKAPMDLGPTGKLLAREVTGRIPILNRVPGFEKPSIPDLMKWADGVLNKTGKVTTPVEAPSIPQTEGVEWGKGKYGTPVSQWGQKVAEPPPAPPPLPEPIPPPTRTAIGRPNYPAGRNIDLSPGMQTPGGAVVAPRIKGLLPGEVASPQPIPTPEPAAEAAASDATPARSGDVPRTLSGDSALRQILTGQDNANLLKIARSRGINVTKEAQLKPGVADTQLINKIIEDHSPEELDGVAAQYLENSRFKHSFGDIGAEAWKTLSLKSYFPDLKIPDAVLKRTQAAIEQASKPTPALSITLPTGTTEEDLSPLLKESLRRARAARGQ